MNTDLIFMFLVGIMAINHFIIRSKQWHEQMWIYWICQISNVLFGSYMLLWGLPEFKAHLEIINILVGLLFFYHSIQNHMHLQKYQRQKKLEESSD